TLRNENRAELFVCELHCLCVGTFECLDSSFHAVDNVGNGCVRLYEVIDGADACLDANGVPESKQKILKIYGVRHMLAMQANSGKGTVKSERAPSGASRSYSDWQGKGVEATPYGSMLKQLDSTGCVVGILQNDNQMAFMVVGRGC
ncbi:MAG: hypothetical protein V4440_05385, partial [Pseudomonadota bacterium]